MAGPLCFVCSPCALPAAGGALRRRPGAGAGAGAGAGVGPRWRAAPPVLRHQRRAGARVVVACASAPHQQQQQQQREEEEEEEGQAGAGELLEHAPEQQDQPPPAPLAAAAARKRDDDDPERRARRAEARLEAERLELLAAQAALASERAQLVAERKRLELDTLKAEHEGAVARRRSDAPVADAKVATPVDSAPPTSSVTPETPLAAPGPSVPSPGDTSKIPPPISPKMLTELLGVDFPRLTEEDINTLKDKVCSMNTFYVTNVERSPFDERVVFRGNLRVESAVALDELEAHAKREGLQDRVRLFILMDPKETSSDNGEKPVIVALPAAALPNQTTTPATILSVIAALATILTALSYGIGIFGLNPSFLDKLATSTLELQQALYTLPISLGALAIVLAHEVAHRVAALRHNIKLGLPVFLPSLQVGTYGTITPLQSYPRNRTGLFDVAASGPVVGVAVSLATLIAGLALTSSGEVADWFPQIPSTLFKGSLLVGALGNLILPAGIREQATLAVHPLLVVGYTGLLVNALNLVPIGRLDGGRIVQALFGRATAGRISGVAYVVQGIATIVGNSSLLLYWSLVCIFLQREGEYPCQDEVTEPNNVRFVVGLGLLLLMISVLTPIPDQVGRLWT